MLADLDRASMRQGYDELTSPALRKKVRLLGCDISGGVSADLNRLIGQQRWEKLVSQGAQVVFDAAADCIERCPVPELPKIEGLHTAEFGVVISSLLLSQLFSYPLLDILDQVKLMAPHFLGEQERHRLYQKASQKFRVRVIQEHLHLLNELVDVGGIVVLLSDVRGFVFEVFGTENDAQSRRTLPIMPRGLAELVGESFTVLEERHWESFREFGN